MKDWLMELCPEIAEWQAEIIVEQVRIRVESEREACAKVCEDLPVFGSYRDLQTATLEDAAAAIRARGEK